MDTKTALVILSCVSLQLYKEQHFAKSYTWTAPERCLMLIYWFLTNAIGFLTCSRIGTDLSSALKIHSNWKKIKSSYFLSA